MVVPKSIRDQLGFAGGMELELEVVDGRLEVAAPSRVRMVDGPDGPYFTADTDEQLTVEQVRELIERGRR